MKKLKYQAYEKMTPTERIRHHLASVYGDAESENIWPELNSIIEKYSQEIGDTTNRLDRQEGSIAAYNAILITYGDQFQETGLTPLQSLNAFLQNNLSSEIDTFHILPFYPYSSDDGFSVIDFRQVDPNLGSWDDILALSQGYALMFDAVVNHISRHSHWFQGFLRDEEPYKDYFITVDPDTDLSKVIRPRTSPLLTPFETADGIKHVWTTFSDDQVDLNFANPQVLLEFIDLLLFYIQKGAQIIRLDAIAFIWKEIGTSCIHLPQTHHIVKIFRAVIDQVAPWVKLITETNVPHEENISYFGDPLPVSNESFQAPLGDEAHLVYQFPLAPLVLHTFHSGDASLLSSWASGLELPYRNTTFFNFIASHDGIGVRPAEGLLDDLQIQALVERTQQHGGYVSSRAKPDGSSSVYELNITLYDALNDPHKPQPEIDVRRFLASQVIMLSLVGVPGIYIHSLFGSRNCHACVDDTGRARSINRDKFQRTEIQVLLSDSQNHQSSVFSHFKHLLFVRRRQPAFKPDSSQQILSLDKRLFALLRWTPEGSARILCLVNVSHQQIKIDLSLTDIEIPTNLPLIDLIGGRTFEPSHGHLHLEIDSYQSLWITTTNY
jgi:glucosylglycerate phosphorylase